jgi:hypothetical protein
MLESHTSLTFDEAVGIVTAPGCYDMTRDIYHRDPCDTPSLSSGMINDLLIAPKKCWHNSQRLNPKWEPPEKQEKFSIGSVSHVMFLEPDQFHHQVVVVRAFTKDGKPSDSWSTTDAKDQRDRAFSAGKTPILAHQYDTILKAREAFFANEFTRGAFTGGKAEQSMFWRHKHYGFWCRSRPDYFTGAWINDYKATGNADPDNFGKHAYNMRYHRRAAWYLEGYEAIFGKRPDHYWFCNQEVKAPFLTSVCELDWGALEDGQAENDHAAGVFAHCLETGEWYGYRHRSKPDKDRAFTVSLPPWSMMEIDRRLARDLRYTSPSVRPAEEEEVE